MLSFDMFLTLVVCAGFRTASALPRGGHGGYGGGHGSSAGSGTTAVATTAAATSTSPSSSSGAETHSISLTNNCGSGTAVFIYAGSSNPQGSTTISGPVDGGLAYLEGYGDCEANGVNCGIVEFTLTNPGSGSAQNAADYSLLTGSGLGNHQYTYEMDFAFTGSCTNGPGACTGGTAAECPGAYLGSATSGGAPSQCLASNTGISITFC